MANTTPTTKAEFYARYLTGEFGNYMRVWKSASEFLSDEVSKSDLRVGIRQIGRPGSGLWLGPAREAARRLEAHHGAPCAVQEAPNDRRMRCQGTMQGIGRRAYLEFSLIPGLTMLQAMRNPQIVTGLTAQCVLDTFAWPKSLAMLEELQVQHPTGYIEFGIYDYELGVMPGHNTIVWEVRSY